MTADPLRILQVNKSDQGGGAASVAWNLFNAYRSRGFESWMVVDQKYSSDPDVLSIENDRCRKSWARAASSLANRFASKDSAFSFTKRIAHWVRFPIGQPGRWLGSNLGHEDFSFPASRHIAELPPGQPDIVHLHNLHANYFDLAVLPRLCTQYPLVMTLHDAWLLSGHCAHSFDCQRWLTGCGHCPDLTIYPALHRDGTAFNWKRKRRIYSQSRLYITTPCQWLMDRVERSILVAGIAMQRVIPNGVDLTIFHPADQPTSRQCLGLPEDAFIVLFTASGIRDKKWRDFKAMCSALESVADQFPNRKLLFIALGEDAPAELIKNLEIRFVPYESMPERVAAYYQSSDIYLHFSRADTFPTAILEALACGRPVVANRVGGIPEQVKSLSSRANRNGYTPRDATGILVDASSLDQLVSAITTLIENVELRRQLGVNALVDARDRFSLQDQVDRYLDWYQEIWEHW